MNLNMEISLSSLMGSSRDNHRQYLDQDTLTNESMMEPYPGRALHPGADVPLRTQSRDSFISRHNN